MVKLIDPPVEAGGATTPVPPITLLVKVDPANVNWILLECTTVMPVEFRAVDSGDTELLKVGGMTPALPVEMKAEVPPETETLPPPWAEDTKSPLNDELTVLGDTAVGEITPFAPSDV